LRISRTLFLNYAVEPFALSLEDQSDLGFQGIDADLLDGVS